MGLEEKCNQRNKRGPDRTRRLHCYGRGESEGEDGIFAQITGIQIQVDLKPKCVLFPRPEGNRKPTVEAPIGGREYVHWVHHGLSVCHGPWGFLGTNEDERWLEEVLSGGRMA